LTKLWEIKRRTTERFFGPDRSFERAQAADVSVKVVAERPMAHLERSGFVIMREPIPVGGR
jgi:hypothetical protein